MGGAKKKRKKKKKPLQERSVQLGTSSLRYPYMYYAVLLVQVQLPAPFSGEAQIYFRIKKAEQKTHKSKTGITRSALSRLFVFERTGCVL